MESKEISLRNEVECYLLLNKLCPTPNALPSPIEFLIGARKSRPNWSRSVGLRKRLELLTFVENISLHIGLNFSRFTSKIRQLPRKTWSRLSEMSLPPQSCKKCHFWGCKWRGFGTGSAAPESESDGFLQVIPISICQIIVECENIHIRICDLIHVRT